MVNFFLFVGNPEKEQIYVNIPSTKNVVKVTEFPGKAAAWVIKIFDPNNMPVLSTSTDGDIRNLTHDLV